MRIHGHQFTITQLCCLFMYYSFAKYLPATNKCFNVGGLLRAALCKKIFRKCGKHVNIERGATFGVGIYVELGDYSGIGKNAVIPCDSKIGKYVMMGPSCHILSVNHVIDSVDIPMMFQGDTPKQPVVIEDDVWIGQNVTIMPGKVISKGSVIAACCVLTKNFPAYSVVGGNPGKLIRSRV